MTLPIEDEFLGHFPLSAPVARSTARLLAVDVSRDAARASSGYLSWDGSQEVVMPESMCACGGRIVAETRAPADVTAAVQIHNETGRHINWRERNGL